MRKTLIVSLLVGIALGVAVLQSSDLRKILAPKTVFLTEIFGITPVSTAITQAYDERFRSVSTASDTGELDTIVYLADRRAPLIVSLHEWSSNWLQFDPLAPHIADLEYHYVHPNHQGANQHPDACLSEMVVSDIDKAIQWAIDRADVDQDSIIVTGMSGGAYTALGYRQLTELKVKHTFAWAAMTDLNRWYHESIDRQNKYADDMLGCIGGQYNQELLQERSPLYNDENANGKVSLFAGINDGHDGAVPVSHSISYFNKLASPEKRIDSLTVERLLMRKNNDPVSRSHERDIYLDASSNGARLLVFEGGHEMLVPWAVEELKSAVNR